MVVAMSSFSQEQLESEIFEIVTARLVTQIGKGERVWEPVRECFHQLF